MSRSSTTFTDAIESSYIVLLSIAGSPNAQGMPRGVGMLKSFCTLNDPRALVLIVVCLGRITGGGPCRPLL